MIWEQGSGSAEQGGMRITCHHKRNQHRACCNEVLARADRRRVQPDRIRRNGRQMPLSEPSAPFVYQRRQSATFRNACHAFVSSAHWFPSARSTCGCARWGSLSGRYGTTESTGWPSARPEAYIYLFYMETCIRRMRLAEFTESYIGLLSIPLIPLNLKRRKCTPDGFCLRPKISSSCCF